MTVKIIMFVQGDVLRSDRAPDPLKCDRTAALHWKRGSEMKCGFRCSGSPSSKRSSEAKCDFFLLSSF